MSIELYNRFFKRMFGAPVPYKWAALTILWSVSHLAAGFVTQHTTISHLIANHYNIACIKILHLQRLSRERTRRIFQWIKHPPDMLRKSIGVMSFQEEARSASRESSCFKAMNVLMEEENVQLAFTQLSATEDIDRSLWLIFINADIQEFFDRINLPFSMELLAVRSTKEDHAEINEVYRVDMFHPVRVSSLGWWSKTQGLRMTSPFLYNRRKDLEGKVLRIGLLENWPISYERTQNGERVWDGLFPAVWRQIEETINASSVHVRSVELIPGSERSDESWSGLIGMAMRDEIDVIVSELTINVHRSAVLDFTRPLLKSRYQIYFKDHGSTLNWMAIFKPFPLDLWQAIVGWIFILSFGLTVCYAVGYRYGIEMRGRTSYSFSSSFFYTLQSLAQQGRDDPPKSMSCRIIFFSSYLVSAVVIPAYSASLISSLTQKTPDRPFNSINEMVLDGSYKLLVSNDTAEYDYFATSNDPLLTSVFRRLIATVPRENSINRLGQAFQIICREEKYAIFGIEAVIARRLMQDSRIPCKITSMARPVSSVYLGMALIKDNQYHPLINYHLQLMIENGLLSRIEMSTWQNLPQKLEEPWREVQTEEVFQMFAFLATAIVISIIILLIEVMIFRRKRPKVEYHIYIPYKN